MSFGADVVPLTPRPTPAIFLQDACFQHQYIRSRDTSAIVERPERLRAVTVGLAAAISRLEEVATPHPGIGDVKPLDPDDLASQLGRLNIKSGADAPLARPDPPVSIVQSSASVDILSHHAVKYVHGDIDGDVYLENLVAWTKQCRDKVDSGESEIPAHLSQGDLYREWPPRDCHSSCLLFSKSLSGINRCYSGCDWYRVRGCRCRRRIFATYLCQPTSGDARTTCKPCIRSHPTSWASLWRGYAVRILFHQQRRCWCCPW
jgi:hypothetical protein